MLKESLQVIRSVARTGHWEEDFCQGISSSPVLLEGLGLETVDFKISLRQQLTYVENSLNYPDSALRLFLN